MTLQKGADIKPFGRPVHFRGFEQAFKEIPRVRIVIAMMCQKAGCFFGVRPAFAAVREM